MKSALILAVLVVMFSLAGCSTAEVRPDVKLITVEKMTLVEPDAKYLNNCKVEPWPFSKTFHTLGMDEKEDALTRALMAQYANTALCSSDKKALREQLVEQRKLVNEFNAAQEARALADKAALEKGQ